MKSPTKKRKEKKPERTVAGACKHGRYDLCPICDKEVIAELDKLEAPEKGCCILCDANFGACMNKDCECHETKQVIEELPDYYSIDPKFREKVMWTAIVKLIYSINRLNNKEV